MKNNIAQELIVTKRGELLNTQCPSRNLLHRITQKWSLLIFLSLHDKTMRFSELRRNIDGISEKMLAKTLQMLEEDGFITKKSYPVIPPHTEYSLTELGLDFFQRVVLLCDWVESNYQKTSPH